MTTADNQKPLPFRQHRVLAYLASRGAASARDVAADLRMSRTDADNTLRLLAGKGLVSPGQAAYPVSFTVTGQGRAELAGGQS